ncbi:hypothetical protein [Candidatus Contendibacter odensensis]|nr:hypothetical protein [Candidatus Contendobacter odensis]
MRIPHAEQATVDIRKLRDYCMNPLHPQSKHKPGSRVGYALRTFS